MNVTSPVRTVFVLVLTASLLALGCGDSSGKVLPVQGKVTLKTQPLATGTITFHPDVAKGNKSTMTGVGNIADGQFTLATGPKPGAPAGWYKVTITATAPSDPKNEYSIPKSLIHSKYGDAAQSGLVAEVKDGTGSYDFTVTP